MYRVMCSIREISRDDSLPCITYLFVNLLRSPRGHSTAYFMNRDEIRDWDSDTSSGDSREATEDAQWKTTNEEVADDVVDLPSFEEAQAMHQALYDFSETRLTGGFCYYLGVLDGPEESDLSPANKDKHTCYLDHRIEMANKKLHTEVLKKHGIGLPELLRVYISCMHFGDTDPRRADVARWYYADDTVDAEAPSYRYTPFEHFTLHNAQYIERITNQVCPGVYYLIEPADGDASNEKNVFLQQDLRSAIQAILWKCQPVAEKMSYRLHSIEP